MTTSQHRIALVPHDTIFFKDGRGWFTSETGRGHALEWPFPSTIRGALRTAWGRGHEGAQGRPLGASEWETQTRSIRLGKTVALRRSWNAQPEAWERVWPVPADVHVDAEGGLERLDPRPCEDACTLGRNDDPARERLWTARTCKSKPGKKPRWWSEAQFVSWLAGADPSSPRLHEPVPRLHRRFQAHVSICASTGAAVEQMLYSHEVVETIDNHHEWAIGCEVELPSRTWVDIATLGSDRRLARVEALSAAPFNPPEQLVAAFKQHPPRGLRLIAVTPCSFAGGWLPDGLERHGDHYRGRLPGIDAEVVLRAALVERPIAVSGWDMLNNAPRPTTRMIPPGSVYMFERLDDQPFSAEHAQALWLAAIGDRSDEGFGRVVPAIWNPRS